MAENLQAYPELLASSDGHAHVPVDGPEKELLGCVHGAYIEYGAVMYQRGRKDATLAIARDEKEGRKLFSDEAVGCGCDEFPECTHALYFYMGVKHAEKSDWRKSQLAQWMHGHSFSTGHGDSVEDLFKELTWQIEELRAIAGQRAPKKV